MTENNTDDDKIKDDDDNIEVSYHDAMRRCTIGLLLPVEGYRELYCIVVASYGCIYKVRLYSRAAPCMGRPTR